jgi:acyl-homoserine lactone acylase PvdQ
MSHGSPRGQGVCFSYALTCTFQIPGGQSGDIDSPNYEDLLPKWLANEPMPLVLDIAVAETNAQRTVQLGQ